MSHDQKPGKVRVVGGGDVQYGRRAGDVVNAVVTDPTSTATVAEDVGEPVPRRSQLLLPVLFVSGCAIGGAALPLMRVL